MNITHSDGVRRWRWLLLLASLCFAPWLQAAPADSDGLEEAVSGLLARSFNQKAQAVERIAAIDDERVVPLLKTLLEGDLYYRRSDDRIVYAQKNDDGYRVTDALTGEELGQAGRRAVRPVRINNSMRVQLRSLIAQLTLFHKDPEIRLHAVEQMLGSRDADSVALLREAVEKETDADVRKALVEAIAVAELESADADTRLAAVEQLAGSVQQDVRNRLRAMTEQQEGKFLEPDARVREAAAQALKNIEFKLEFYDAVQTTFFGLSLGSVLLLAAIGLAITFGVMGVINMAHGELIMLGAYTTYVVQLLMPNHIEYSLLVAVPAAFLVAGAVGVAIERGVIRFLYGRPLETLLATFGISLILQQAVRSIFSPLNRSVATPEWMSGSWEINSALALTYNRLYIILFALAVFTALLMVLKRTSLGLKVRAVSQNRTMARAMGVRAQWVDAMTFGLGSGIAGVAGVALSQLTNVGPNLGQAYIIDSFMVVVFGGVGNLWGTLVGAFSLGVANKYLEPYSGAVLAKILVLVFIILFIQKRPRGLFPQKGRAAEG